MYNRSMMRLLACLAALALLSISPAVLQPVHAQTEDSPMLIAVPAQGHMGDRLYVSGWGFQPNAVVLITLACPSWLNSNHGNVMYVPGPKTDKYGRFVAFTSDRLRALQLHGLTQSACHVYASDRNNYFASATNYQILPAGVPLGRCARTICLKVQAITSGSQFSFTVRGWPGATVRVRIQYPDGHVQRTKTLLNYQGTRLLRLPAQERLPTGSAVLFSMHASMNTMNGNTTGSIRYSADSQKTHRTR